MVDSNLFSPENFKILMNIFFEVQNFKGQSMNTPYPETEFAYTYRGNGDKQFEPNAD